MDVGGGEFGKFNLLDGNRCDSEELCQHEEDSRLRRWCVSFSDYYWLLALCAMDPEQRWCIAYAQ
jgi:hypothetical protein